MPRVFPNNKYWLRSGHMNQKHHIDMTEDEKANIARCTGKKAGHICKNPLFRCTDCGNYGCSQEVLDVCTDQGFKNDKCLHCGATGTRLPIMKEELAEFIEKFQAEVPLAKD